MFASADCDSHKQPLPKFLPSTHVIISKETKFDIQSALAECHAHSNAHKRKRFCPPHFF